MYFADAPPDEPLGEANCCGFNVYFIAVRIEIYYNSGKLAAEHCEAKWLFDMNIQINKSDFLLVVKVNLVKQKSLYNNSIFN